jgi:capsid protein
LAGDLSSVNYSSARIGLLEDRTLWESLQSQLIDIFCLPVYNAWLEMGLLKTAIVNNLGQPLPAFQKEKYSKVIFLPRRWHWVDPSKEATAYKLQLAMGLRSRADILREQGIDPDQMFAEIAEEQRLFQQLGIKLPDDANSVPTNLEISTGTESE